jgi:hypothetical protein
MSLIDTAYMPETSWRTLRNTATKSTTLLKLTYAWPLPSQDNLKTLLQLDVYKLTSVSPLPRSKREVRATTDRHRVPTLRGGRSDLTIVTTTTIPLFFLWPKKEVVTMLLFTP